MVERWKGGGVMGRNTNIEWCDSTVNPTTGCQGCELWAGQVRTCYAGQLQTKRLSRANPDQYATDFTEVRLAPGRMAQAAAWSDLAGTSRPDKPWLDGMPRTIFVGDMGDIFSAAVPFEYLRDEVFAAIDSPAGRRHIWMLLTKQPQRMRRVAQLLGHWPDNAWAGVSVTSQVNASRIEHLVDVPAPIRFVSAEPLLGKLMLRNLPVSSCRNGSTFDALTGGGMQVMYDGGVGIVVRSNRRVHFVIVGGESGTGARDCNLAHVRWLQQQCRRDHVPFFLKQVGSCAFDGLWTLRGQSQPTEPRYLKLRDSKGGNPDEWPEDLRVREFPRVGAAAEVVPHG